MDHDAANLVIAEMRTHAELADDAYRNAGDANNRDALLAARTARWNHYAGAIALQQAMSEHEAICRSTHRPREYQCMRPYQTIV